MNKTKVINGIACVLFALCLSGDFIYAESEDKEQKIIESFAKENELWTAEKNDGTTKIAFQNGEGLLSGPLGVYQKIFPRNVKESAISASVDFYLSSDLNTWQSIALALYGENLHPRILCMVAYRLGGGKEGVGTIGIEGGKTKKVELDTEAWYTLGVDFNGVRGEVWIQPRNKKKERIVVSKGLVLKKVEAIGVRVFGNPVRVDNFLAQTKKHEKPPGIVRNNDSTKLAFNAFGQIESAKLKVKDEWREILFNENPLYAGPTWIVKGKEVEVKEVKNKGKTLHFSGQEDDVKCTLKYKGNDKGQLIIRGELENISGKDIKDIQAGIRLGVDTYMETYPEWNEKFFPTMMRCEKTHMIGYFRTPARRNLTIACPQPVASYQINYGQHRIYTTTINVLNPLPLPSRHPQNLHILKAGEKKSWTFVLEEVDRIDDIMPTLSKNAQAPTISSERYTMGENESSIVTVHSSSKPTAELAALNFDDGRIDPNEKHLENIVFKKTSPETYSTRLSLPEKEGFYSLSVKDAQGKTSEAVLTRRKPWSWYLKQARINAIEKPQKSTTHIEGWLGFASIYAAEKHFPDPALLKQADKMLLNLYEILFDEKIKEPTVMKERIANSAYTAGFLKDRYLASGELWNMEQASGLVEFLITRQHDDGGYYNGNHLYTSVAYIAKSVMEVAEVEEELGETSEKWKKRAIRHFDSARRANLHLESLKGDLSTEGEHTYEDGMISCTATQLAMQALRETDPKDRKLFTDGALAMMQDHLSLAQDLIPDSRMNGGTLRFWEAQYDVLMQPNMMNSPHGWSGWRIPGLYYLYQLTGDEIWLQRMNNAMGSCASLMNMEDGDLRWAFISDPYIRANCFVQDTRAPSERPINPNTGRPHHARSGGKIIGEQYMPMISSWHKVQEPPYIGWPHKFVPGVHGHLGGSCDNDVHEIFKVLEESVLTNAFVIERENGEIIGYNCSVEKRGDKVLIKPNENIVSNVHLNFQKSHNVIIAFSGGKKTLTANKGMNWVRAK